MEKKHLFLIFFILLTFFSCSKKEKVVELKYTVTDIDNIAHETSPSNEKGEGAMNIADYSPGVNALESKALMYKHLSFFAVSFETTELARNEALRLNQYYSRNWLFDRVEGEPVLEDYVILKFNAQNPKRQKQRTPKKENSEHGGAHESAPHH